MNESSATFQACIQVVEFLLVSKSARERIVNNFPKRFKRCRTADCKANFISVGKTSNCSRLFVFRDGKELPTSSRRKFYEIVSHRRSEYFPAAPSRSPINVRRRQRALPRTAETIPLREATVSPFAAGLFQNRHRRYETTFKTVFLRGGRG